MLRRFAPFAADLWQHRQLLWQFTLRNVELRHKGSHLGLIWSILNPLLLLGLYVVVFGYIFEGRFGMVTTETRTDYALGIFVGLTFFHFVSEVLSVSPGFIVAYPNFVKKVVFPLSILPAAGVGAALFHMIVGIALSLLGVLLAGVPLTWAALWLPVIVLPLLFLALGIAWFFSAIGVFARDIGQIMQFVTIALMWCSGIFFSAQRFPAAWKILRFNPVLLAINQARDVVLWHQPVNFHHVGYLYASGLLAALIGHWLFCRMRPAFADVL